MPLTDRENYLRTVEMTGPEWMPCTVAISGASRKQLGMELEDVLVRHPRFFPGFQKGKQDYTKMEFGPANRAGERFKDAWGCVWYDTIDGIEGQVIERPLDDWAKFASYQAPDPLKTADRGPVDWESSKRHCAEAKAKGHLTMGGVPHGFLFMRLYYLRGFENLMIDFADDEPKLSALIEMLVEHNRKIVEQWLSFGVDVVSFGDDLGTQTAAMVSPATFRKHITPAYKRLMKPCRDAGAHVFLHSDGHMLELLDEILEAGADIVNPQDLCHGIDNLARELKGRVCTCLDVDRQKIVPFGTRKEIHDLIEEETRKLGSPQGGLMMIAGIYPPTPPENIDALCCAMEEFRTYWWDGRA
ncbi:MAG TPA: uroporphyrinogen decarboxylase family protein [Candidatus Brocadiia bacterium]|nr:uroporphyrinogen decarboxylase family protein [Candidatus Brocadiia bacterium]